MKETPKRKTVKRNSIEYEKDSEQSHLSHDMAGSSRIESRIKL